MKVLFVVGYCLKVNSSANLCHLAYINGFVEMEHDVDLIMASSKGQNIDKSIVLPKVNSIYEYDVALYEQYGGKKSSNAENSISKKNSANSHKKNFSIKSLIIGKIKRMIRKSYGVYSTTIVWKRNAMKFKNDKQYDLVISLAYPPVSHKLASDLIKNRHIKTNKWIQIWEDPWYCDLVSNDSNIKIKKEEEKLVGLSDRIVYVSPLTLRYQQSMFDNSSDRMCWHPLPSYYTVENKKIDFNHLIFGYFGDYVSSVRNLSPFINTVIHNDIETNICGTTDLNVYSAGKVSIYPRLPLNELKEYEDKTNVIVFLCNLKGGQIPGKIYQYSATNKIILFILDGTEEEKNIIKEYFSQFNRYIFCENNEVSIKSAINSIQEYIKKPNYTMPLDVFNSKNIVKDLLREVDM